MDDGLLQKEWTSASASTVLGYSRARIHITQGGEIMNRITTFSPCRKYRYTLWRKWGNGDDYAMFIGLNPSTADETEDDPTIRRCVGYAKEWEYSGLCMTNLFSFRATKPKEMFSVLAPVGKNNDIHLMEVAKKAGIVIAAWGTHGGYLDRDKRVCSLIENLNCLSITKKGFPGHPLYLKKGLIPFLFNR